MRRCLLLISYLFILTSSHSQTGSLDPSFGDNGIAKANFTGFGSAFANIAHKVLQKGDGTYFVLIEINGQAVIAHRMADGSADLNYGNEGYSDPAYFIPQDAALQYDGKIVVTGQVYAQNTFTFALGRFNTDGSLDKSFGANGTIMTPFTGEANAYSVAIQNDGKIIAAGRSYTENGYAFTLVRYNRSGILDASFGTGGIGQTPFVYNGTNTNAVIQSISLQSDGKIVAAGWAATNSGDVFALARYNNDGSLDNTFGSTGKVLTPISTNAFATSLILQNDGKIVLAGGNEVLTETEYIYTFALARYTSNGSLDNTFGTNGTVTTTFTQENVESGYSYETSAFSYSVGVQADGKLVAGGATESGQSQFALARYNPNGSLDHTFDEDGKITTPFVFGNADTYSEESNALIYSIDVETSGKIIAAGSAVNSSTRGDGALPPGFALALYNTDGTLDESFARGNGKFAEHINTGISNFNHAIIQPDGKIVTVGKTRQYDNYDCIIARFNTNGSLDNTFGTNGMVETTNNLEDDFATASFQAVDMQKDGKILAAGWVDNKSTDYESNFALTRFNTDGSLDNTFGNNGMVVTQESGAINSIIIQNNGKIIGVGGEDHFTIARYNPDGSLDASFGNNGIVQTSLIGEPYYSGPAYAVAIQNDGKIVAAGSGNGNFGLARYNPDGSLDATFGTNGIITTPFTYDGNQASARAKTLSVQNDGKIIAAGDVNARIFNPANPSVAFALARYNPDGSLDHTFGNSGTVITTFASEATAYSISVQGDGKIVVSGSGGGLALARYNTDGSLDASFGGDGKVMAPVNLFIYNTLLTINRIYAIGTTPYYGNVSAIAAFQYNTTSTTSIQMVPLSLTNYCQGATLPVSYTATGTFAAGNVFTAQLSDALGSFATATAIGKVTAITSGTINATIPADAPAGTEYRIRVVSSNPAITGTDNGSNLTIHALPTVTIPDAFVLTSGVLANTVYIGYAPASSLTLSAQPTNSSDTYTYKWSTGATTASISVNPTTTTTYSVTAWDAAGCSNTATKVVSVVDIRCGNNMDKVTVCSSPGNSGKILSNCIAPAAVSSHIANGASLGSCATSGFVANNVINNRKDIEENTSGLSLKALPNPSHTSFTLGVNSNTNEKVTIRIMDAVGRILEERKVSVNGTLQIGASFRPGIYYAQVIQGEQKVIVKLIKQAE